MHSYVLLFAVFLSVAFCMMGGYHPRDVNDPDVLEAASFAVSILNSHSNSMHPHSLKKVVEASSQVVAGVNFKIVLETSRGNSVERHEVVVYKGLGTNGMTLSSHKSL
ncbi:hypothetical protein RCL1_002318 [Eukaryota sp. TZLM3-RCL]